jgi:hypothetical protein
MLRALMISAFIVGAAFAPLLASAEDKFTLKSVNVDLPASDRTFPTGPGSDLATGNCLACHSAGMVLNQPRFSRAVWEAEVNKMINAYKAPISKDHVGEIVDYLSQLQPTE